MNNTKTNYICLVLRILRKELKAETRDAGIVRGPGREQTGQGLRVAHAARGRTQGSCVPPVLFMWQRGKGSRALPAKHMSGMVHGLKAQHTTHYHGEG